MTIDKRGTCLPTGPQPTRRCCICGDTMTAPQKTLNLDGKAICDACYDDCFFADMGSYRHPALDRYEG